MRDGCILHAFVVRGIRRGSLLFLSIGFALLFLTATGARAQTAVGPVTLTVTTLGDSTGTCNLAASPNPTCTTLRAAIAEVNNSNVNGDTINFKSGPNLTGDLTGTITLTSALPAVNVGLIIQGPGANLLAISGAGSYQILNIQHGAASISGLTFANGSTAQSGQGGGAILYAAPAGDLTITDCTFSGNSAYYYTEYGGAIADNSNSGKLTITNSTFADNIASGGGGAVQDTSTGELTVINSTFVNNGHSPKPGYNPTGTGGAINCAPLAYTYTPPVVTVVDSTFTDNSAAQGGGAIATGGTTLYAANDIFSGNSALYKGGGIELGLHTTLSGEDYNLFYKNARGNIYDRTTNSDPTLGANDVTGQDPKLLPLGHYGGPTQTMMPEVGSSAIGVGADSSELLSVLPSGVTAPSTDQRGFPLFNAAGPVDIGAVQTNYLVVTSTSGGSAGADCTSAQTSATCSLSDAVTAANSSATSDTDIGFGTSLGSGSPFTIAPSATLSLSQGNTVIVGPPDAVTISGGGNTQIFSMGQYSPANLTLYGLILTNGHKNSGNGGAIGHDGYGTVTISDCYLFKNTSNNGGAIEVSNNGALIVIDSTFFDNIASPSGGGGDGGAIFNYDGRVTVTNTTFARNIANSSFSGTTVLIPGQGAAILNYGKLTLTDDTFARNFTGGGQGGAIYNDSNKAVTVANSIFSDNTAATGGGIYDHFGTITTGYDLFYQNFGGDSNASNFPATGDILESSSGPDPVASLASYGGPTQTVLTLPGPAICAGLPADVPGGTLTDQRGFPRTTTYTVNSNPLTCVDIGAVQTHYGRIQFVSPPTNGYTETSGQVVDQPAPVVSVIENGRNTGGVPVTLTLSPTPSPSDVTGNTATTQANAGATFGNLNVSVNATTTYTLSSTLDLFTAPGGTPVSITTNPTTNPSLTVTSPTIGTSTTLSFSPPTTTYGSTVTFTTTVSPDSGTTVPTGTVSFSIDGTSGSGALETCPAGTASYSLCASYSTSSLSAGSHTVSASFTPKTSAFSGSTSTPATFTIAKATPKITFGPTPSPTYLGGDFTVSASTTNTDSPTLTFSASGPCSLVSALTANPATLSSSGAGTCAVTATGAATTNFASASNTLDVTIAKATPTVSISNLPTNALVGQSFTPDVVVSPSSDKGTVTVTLTASDTGICTLGANGVVNFVGPTTSGGTGTCTLDVSVTGSTDFNAVSDQPVSFTIESDQIAIQTIANGVENLSLKNGEKNSMLKELDQASKMISEGKISGAINNLNLFIGEVQDLASSGKLSSTLAARLIYDTNVIISALDSQL